MNKKVNFFIVCCKCGYIFVSKKSEKAQCYKCGKRNEGKKISYQKSEKQ